MYIIDLDVFVLMMLLEDSLEVPSLDLLCKVMVHSFEWKKGEPPSMTEPGKVIRCKFENCVPIVGVSEEPRFFL